MLMMMMMMMMLSWSMALALSSIQPSPQQQKRDILVLARGRMDDPSKVRSLAQCATAALHLQTGMRQETKLWLLLPDHRGGGLTLACNGAEAQPLPVMGKTIKQVLECSLLPNDDSLASLLLPPGWQVYDSDNTLEQRLASLVLLNGGKQCRRLVVIDGSGLSPLLTVETLPQLKSGDDGTSSIQSGTVFLLAADASDYTEGEAECFDLFGGGARRSVSPLPLLPSHSIVLAHAVLDAAEYVPRAKDED